MAIMCNVERTCDVDSALEVHFYTKILSRQCRRTNWTKAHCKLQRLFLFNKAFLVMTVVVRHCLA